MASLEFDRPGDDIATLRKAIKRGAHVQRAQRMLAAASLCTCGIVAVAAALLFHVF